MTLQVPFDDFAATIKRLEIKEAYLLAGAAGCVVTAHNPVTGVMVSAQAASVAAAKTALEAQGVVVFRGIWSDQVVSCEPEDRPLFVAAVSYVSGQPKPGIWVDAFASEPTHIDVVEALYLEFKETGEMPDISIEEFLRTAQPNVVVIPQARLKMFLEAKIGPLTADR